MSERATTFKVSDGASFAHCPGCGTAYLTIASGALTQHDFASCAAYARGLADGRAAAEREAKKT